MRLLRVLLAPLVSSLLLLRGVAATRAPTPAPPSPPRAPAPAPPSPPRAPACDDAMNEDEGNHLRKVHLPSSGAKLPPPDQAWVMPLLDRVVRDPEFLDDVFSFPKGTEKTGCKLSHFMLTKLCVPKNGTMGSFRAKARLQTNCGLMNVKMRVAVKPQLSTWGRTAS